MATLNDTDGFTLHGWMVTELQLTGADLIAFALVHQFAQSGAGIYKGNTQYLAAWTGWSENTCRAHLVTLVKKGLIQEVRGRENNSPFCYYKLAADFYEKHTSKIEGSPLKNCGDHPAKNGKSTPQKLRGEYTYNESNKGDNNIDKRFVKPTIEEVRAYCRDRGNTIDPEAFVAYYESKGWKVGTAPMRDWKAAVITWERRRKENNNGNKSSSRLHLGEMEYESSTL